MYASVQKYVKRPFKFFCYTEDPRELHPSITPISYVDNDVEPIVYNKIFILSSKCYEFTGQNLYLDIDSVITGDITPILDYCTPGKLATIKAYWKPLEVWSQLDQYPDSYEGFTARVTLPHNINSSVMLWEAGDPNVDQIWEDVCRRKEPILTKYYMGMDAYLFYEQQDKLIFFKPSLVGSYLFGVGYDMSIRRVTRDFSNVRINILNGVEDRRPVFARLSHHYRP